MGLDLGKADSISGWMNSEELEREIGFRPVTEVGEGVARFVRWFREYYRV